MAENWNGTSWVIQSTPNPSTSSLFNAVSCSTAQACTAVGATGGQRLAERWSGTSWTDQTLTHPVGTYGTPTLNGVSCTAPAACTAAGEFFYFDIGSSDFLDIGSESGLSIPLAERYS